MNESWLKEFEAFEESDEACGLELRLSLADLIIKHLQIKGWSQKELAQCMGKREPFISRLIHAETNCTFETAGRVLHALGVDADLVEKSRIKGNSPFDWVSAKSEQLDYGQENAVSQENSETNYRPWGAAQAEPNYIVG